MMLASSPCSAAPLRVVSFLCLLSFVGAIALAKYLEGKAFDE